MSASAVTIGVAPELLVKICLKAIDTFRIAADARDPADPQPQPRAQRRISEHTAASPQGRARLPLALLTTARRQVVRTVPAWGAATATPPRWTGHAVRLRDGTTCRMAPTPDRVTTYGQARNQHGDGDGVIVRSVASFCLDTQQGCGRAEDRPTTRESALAGVVLEADPPNTVFVGDGTFSVYRVAQVAHAVRQHGVLRRQARPARARLRVNGDRGPHPSELDGALRWVCGSDTPVDPTLPCDLLSGRVIFVRLTTVGVRSINR